jgi:hypothetical protein
MLWVAFFGVIFSLANCIFMYQKKLIMQGYFVNFIIATTVFYTIVLFLNNSVGVKRLYQIRKNQEKQVDIDNSSEIYAIGFLLLWVTLQVLKIKVFGVRGIEKIGGGSGLIIRLLWLISPLLNHTVLYMFFYRKWKKTFYLYFLLVFFFAFFSISKSAVINVFFSILVFVFMNPKCKVAKYFIKKYGIIFVSFGIIFGVLLLTAKNRNLSYWDAILRLLYRFIAFGDVYAFAYVDQVADKISMGIDVSFLKYIFSAILPMYRLASHEDFADCNVTGLIVDEVRGPGSLTGPNLRFDVAGYIFWGPEGAILFAIFCAFVFSIVHIAFVNSINKSYKKQMWIIFFVNSLISIEQDVSLIPTFLGNASLLGFIIIIFEMIIMASKNVRKNKVFTDFSDNKLESYRK